MQALTTAEAASGDPIEYASKVLYDSVHDDCIAGVPPGVEWAVRSGADATRQYGDVSG
jgi:hypothetical protein